MISLKKMFEPVDMTVGRPWEDILIFTIPMLLGNIAQQLYNTVDSVVVGNYIGDNALAAVGTAGPIVNLLIVLFVGLSIGASITVSQYFGAKNRYDLSVSIGNCLTLSFIAVVFVMVVATLITDPLLLALNTPDTIRGWSATYLRIIFLGIAGMALYNILSGILRGLGDSVSPLIYLVIASVINIVLDVLFVAKFNMGVAGVALATVIAQAISCILSFRKLFRLHEVFDFKPEYLKMTKKHALTIVKLGIPSGITQAILSLSMLIVQSLINSFGEMFIAANVIVMRVDGFVMLPNFSFGTAMTTYAGQNVGAKAYDRVTQGAKQGTIMAVATSAVITGLALIFGRPLMGIFTNTEELVTLSMNMMRILAVGYLAMGVTQSLAGVMRGAGDTITPMWLSVFQTFVLRMGLAYGLVYLTRSEQFPQGRKECIFVSLLVSWLIGALLNFIFYKKGKWRTRAIQ